MENVEGQEKQAIKTDAEVQNVEAVDAKVLMEKIAQLESTNDRLLSQSKENADKFRTLRDSNSEREKKELLDNENYKGLLGKKSEEHNELLDRFETLSKKALKKDLNFTVAKLIDKPLADGASVDDVIEQVLKTGEVILLDDESGFTGIEEAYNKVKESKSFLFDSKKANMLNKVPSNKAPQGKKLSNTEQLGSALESIFKNKG